MIFNLLYRDFIVEFWVAAESEQHYYYFLKATVPFLSIAISEKVSLKELK